LDRDDLYDWVSPYWAAFRTSIKIICTAKIPSWNSFVEHPSYDEFWKEGKSVGARPASGDGAKPERRPVGGTRKIFTVRWRRMRIWKKMTPAHLNYLVVGPWNHGGWAHGPRQLAGTDSICRQTQASIFEREGGRLRGLPTGSHDKGELPLKEALLLFETGSNTWTRFRCPGPPPRRANKKLVFRASMGNLSFEAPKTDATEAFDSYVSDPAKPRALPQPACRRKRIPPIIPARWYTWLVPGPALLSRSVQMC